MTFGKQSAEKRFAGRHLVLTDEIDISRGSGWREVPAVHASVDGYGWRNSRFLPKYKIAGKDTARIDNSYQVF